MNMRNYKLINLGKGEYVVRKGWIFYSYYDFSHGRAWWAADSGLFHRCITIKHKATVRFKLLTNRMKSMDV
jgi:hypothetical protein